MASRLGTTFVGAGPRLALAHGFTQNRRCWGVFADSLARSYELVLVDAPGHGASAEVIADIPTGAALMGDAVGPASYLGYSMGGRHLLRLALDRPDLVERLILIGASPGIVDPIERARRVDADEQLASHLEQVGLDTFLEEWLTQPLFATLPPDDAQLAARRGNTAAGLAASLRTAGTGVQEPLWDRLDTLAMPTLLLVGEQDHKFTDLARRMQSGIGANATVSVVPEAGHAVHLEQPAASVELVVRWLRANGA
jgi:2-succinyl-6-hydroxy-2,4-cyclohexadiene-1-carboxylate synthase